MIMNSTSQDIDDDFPNTTLLSDEDIAAILSSTSTMFMDNDNSNGGGKGSVMEEEQPVTRKRCRASKHTPSTFLIAKPCDFRALVQQLTGCQSADSSYKGPINLNFGAADQEHHDDHTTTTPPMLAFTFDQDNTQLNKKKKIINNHCREQENSSSSVSENKLNMNYDDIFLQEYSLLEYGSDQYSSPAIAAETDLIDDYCLSLIHI